MTSDAPTAPGRVHRVATPVALIVGGSIAAVALHVRDPHTAGSWGVCPTYGLFGVYCPACGSLRAVNDLGNGHLAAAWHSNALFVGLFPALVAALVLWTMREWRGKPPLLTARRQQQVVWAIFALGIAFAIVRNLPIGQALIPA